MAAVMDARVEDYLNDKLQTLADFDALDSLIANVKLQQNLLKQQLDAAEKDLASAHTAANANVAAIREQATSFHSKQADIDRRLLIVTQSDTSQDAVARFEESMAKLRGLDVANAYIETLQRVDALTSMSANDADATPDRALDTHTTLTRLSLSLQPLQDAAEGAAPHLIHHINQQVDAFRQMLKVVFAGQLERVLGKILWPKPGTPLPAILQSDFDVAFGKLLALQRPELEALLPSSPPSALYPLDVMVNPISQRFQYHFSGDRPTNRLDKPEYFFSHIIDLLNAHVDFVNDHIQPILLRHFGGSAMAINPAYIDATSAFITSLLPMLRSKVLSAVAQVRSQPKLLSHLVHELMSFDSVLREEWKYEPASSTTNRQWPGLTHDILIQNNLYEHWIKVEMDFALARYEAIISDLTASELDYDSVSPAASKPSKAAVRVHDLLAAITDHYRPLTSFSQKLRFLIDIQISIFDRFHERLHSGLEAFMSLTSSLGRTVQGASAADLAAVQGVAGLERLCRIYSSAEYLERAMRDWGDDVFFLDLWTELQARARGGGKVTNDLSVQEVAQRTSATLDPDDDKNIDPSHTGALFDETAGAYGRLRARSENVVVETIISAVRDALRTFARTAATWTTMDASMDETSLSVSPDLASLLSTLSTDFAFLRKAIAPLPMRRITRSVGRSIESYIWDRIILANKFTMTGATQLATDVAAVEARLGYDSASMRRCHDALSLLGLKEKPEDGEVGLWDVDKRLFADNESAREMLEELCLDNINENDARKVLRRRAEVGG
ncbi:hypothetical protein FH972_026202 [Carpinus fangiana]|uniref:RINT-1 family protein n=1 Tax=Carpinus fangiana TaxID=176857 RepID=A0A5N6L5V8_9ROSI|nr:hypothetical protein FH972_026202 [Carpinus fangiana]